MNLHYNKEQRLDREWRLFVNGQMHGQVQSIGDSYRDSIDPPLIVVLKLGDLWILKHDLWSLHSVFDVFRYKHIEQRREDTPPTL
jgi:hypothetical protein